MTVSADAIMHGHRISVVLEPDPNFGGYLNALPRYLESYPLPHLSAVGETVWGATRRGHGLEMDGRIASHLGFVYTNALDLYVLYNAIDDPSDPRSAQVQIKMNSARQYAALDLVDLPPSVKVWTSAAPKETDALAASVRAGYPHRIVWREAGGLVRAHPLDLAFLFQETGDVSFRVEAAILPSILADPAAFAARCRDAVPGFDAKLRDTGFSQKGKLASLNPFRIIGTNADVVGSASHFHSVADFEEVAVFSD